MNYFDTIYFDKAEDLVWKIYTSDSKIFFSIQNKFIYKEINLNFACVFMKTIEVKKKQFGMNVLHLILFGIGSY